MTKPRYLILDTKDDRRELANLLSRLPPRERLAWLERQCRRSTLPNSVLRPRIQARTRNLAEKARWDDSASERLTVECWSDLWSLSIQYKLDIDAAVSDLVAMVRRRQLSP